MERLAAKLAAKITDADDWEEAEGYITALPYALYDQLQSYSQAQHTSQPRPQRPHQHRPEQQQDLQFDRRQEPRQGQEQAVPDDRQRHGGSRSRRRRGRSGSGKGRRRTRPPRVTLHHREHRLDEALDAMDAVKRSKPGKRKAVAKVMKGTE